MELDKRIKDIGTIQTCLKYDDNQVGCKGYFFNDFCKLKDLSKCCCGRLVAIFTDDIDDKCFKVESDVTGFVCSFRFFIPEDDLKPAEPKYRAYTLEEFIGDVNLGLGPWIRMRPVGSKKECKFLYTGYENSEVGEYICLGCFQFDLISLFKNYEICINDTWQPFGIKE